MAVISAKASRKPRQRPAPRRRAAWVHTRAPLHHDRRDAVRKVVLEAAYELYRREGYSGVTLRALAEALHCVPTAVYRYFTNKDEIILTLKAAAVALMTKDGMLPDTDDPLADLRAAYWRYYTFSKDQPVYFRLLWADASTPPHDPDKPEFAGIARLGEDARHKLQRCMKAGLLPANTNELDLLSALWCAVHGAAAFRVSGALGAVDFDRMASRGLDLVLAGAKSA